MLDKVKMIFLSVIKIYALCIASLTDTLTLLVSAPFQSVGCDIISESFDQQL